jgi:hypothetical protein
MHYIDWVLFIATISAMLLVAFRIIQGIVKGAICLGQCALQSTQPVLFWLDICVYSIAVLVLISASKRLWKEIQGYKTNLTHHSSGTR